MRLSKLVFSMPLNAIKTTKHQYIYLNLMLRWRLFSWKIRHSWFSACYFKTCIQMVTHSRNNYHVLVACIGECGSSLISLKTVRKILKLLV